MRTMTARGFVAWMTSQPRPKALEHPRRVVLDDEVGLLDQAQHELAALRGW